MERSREQHDKDRADEPAQHEAEARKRDPHERDDEGADGADSSAPAANIQTGTNTGS